MTNWNNDKLRARIRELIAAAEARPGQDIKASTYWTLSAYVTLYLDQTEPSTIEKFVETFDKHTAEEFVRRFTAEAAKTYWSGRGRRFKIGDRVGLRDQRDSFGTVVHIEDDNRHKVPVQWDGALVGHIERVSGSELVLIEEGQDR